MNVVCLCGRIVRDPDTKQSQSGMNVTRFSIAVNRIGKDAGADFINCVAFGKQAEFIGKYFFKGMKIDLSGHLQTGSYTNKDGQRVNTTDVIVDHASFGESRKAAAAEGLTEEPAKREAKKMDDDPSFVFVPDDAVDGLPFE